MSVPDRRLNAYRPDLADEALRGQVEAASFVRGEPARIAVPVADLLSAPGGGVDTQLLMNDCVRVFERAGGFAWVQAERDRYVGYLAETALAPAGTAAPTHHVVVPRSFVYPRDDMKTPGAVLLSLGTEVAVTGMTERRGTHYAELAAGGFVIATHLRPLGEWAHDYVAVAETLEHAPYLWGGTSGLGVDCSGLVQLAMRACDRVAPRDTDMQAALLGGTLEAGPDLSGLRRGDLVFWKGHVAILLDGETIIHASGHSMLVTREPLRQAVDRIAHLYGQPTGFRRP